MNICNWSYFISFCVFLGNLLWFLGENYSYGYTIVSVFLLISNTCEIWLVNIDGDHYRWMVGRERKLVAWNPISIYGWNLFTFTSVISWFYCGDTVLTNSTVRCQVCSPKTHKLFHFYPLSEVQWNVLDVQFGRRCKLGSALKKNSGFFCSFSFSSDHASSTMFYYNIMCKRMAFKQRKTDELKFCQIWKNVSFKYNVYLGYCHNRCC